MEAEHKFVGDAMAEMRHLTGGFTPPADACSTYRVALQELDAFERDLHEHVHLENNVLFPKAIALESGRPA
jgi:regulator of cell morphogenesis and NO signaling